MRRLEPRRRAHGHALFAALPFAALPFAALPFAALPFAALPFAAACGGAEQTDPQSGDAMGMPGSGNGGASTVGPGAEPVNGETPGEPEQPGEPTNPLGTPSPNEAVEPETPGNEPGETGPGEPVNPGEPASSTPGTITRLARLSHLQYQNTLSDLLSIDDPPGDAFPPDALNGFEFETTVDYRVDARLGPQYRAAAEQLGARAASDQAVLDFIVPCDASQQGCSAEFIASFGQRAFRRPLSADEQSRFEALFDSGPELVASGDAFRDGVHVAVEAMLQAPQFLYRTELGDGADATGRIALNGWEVASRISYFLWDTMPNDELFAAAANDALSTPQQIATHVQRMLNDDRATEKLVGFHEQAWQFSKFASIAPDADEYPAAPADIAALADEAGRLFVSDVIDSGGGFAELLTAPYAYANAELAPLYGHDVPGDFTRIDTDDRRGFLMQVGFLAANAYAIKTDPIHRGLFVVRSLLCQNIPDPPMDAAEEGLPQGAAAPETTRDEIALLTGTNENPDPDRQSRCGTCHSIINAPGFAFESFDAVGQVRTTENDVPVNTQGQLAVDGTLLPFADASEMVNLIASSEQGKACYARKLQSFANGHDAAPEDPELEQAVLGATGTVELAALIAQSASFRQRVPNEVAP